MSRLGLRCSELVPEPVDFVQIAGTDVVGTTIRRSRQELPSHLTSGYRQYLERSHLVLGGHALGQDALDRNPGYSATHVPEVDENHEPLCVRILRHRLSEELPARKTRSPSNRPYTFARSWSCSPRRLARRVYTS